MWSSLAAPLIAWLLSRLIRCTGELKWQQYHVKASWHTGAYPDTSFLYGPAPLMIHCRVFFIWILGDMDDIDAVVAIVGCKIDWVIFMLMILVITEFYSMITSLIKNTAWASSTSSMNFMSDILYTCKQTVTWYTIFHTMLSYFKGMVTQY